MERRYRQLLITLLFCFAFDEKKASTGMVDLATDTFCLQHPPQHKGLLPPWAASDEVSGTSVSSKQANIDIR